MVRSIPLRIGIVRSAAGVDKATARFGREPLHRDTRHPTGQSRHSPHAMMRITNEVA